jgi:glycosyltransferase involved in cell wall biosynthesis
VLFVGHSTYDLPLPPHVARKWDALGTVLDVHVIGSRGTVESGAHDPRFTLLPVPGPSAFRGVAYYAALPSTVRRVVREHAIDVVVLQSPYEGAMAQLARLGPGVRTVVEVHGDWRTASRVYGSPARRVLGPISDRVAEWGLRRADGTRAVGPTMGHMVEAATGRAPTTEFPTWFEAERFFERPPAPLPPHPSALWVGVLQRYKDPQTLAAAWRRVAQAVPEVRLTVVGRGPERPVIEALVDELGDRVTLIDWLAPEEVAQAFDRSWLLVLPSASEGLPRVGIESFARGRPVVGTFRGGIPDLVRPGHNGALVEGKDERGLAEVLIRLLGDRAEVERLAAGAAESGASYRWPPERYAAAVRAMVDEVRVVQR